MPKISVVIPTYNRLSRLRQVINALENQDYTHDDFEVVIVSDGATDGTQRYLEDLRAPFHLRPLHQANGGPAAARNAGIVAAKGEFIVFIDDDVVPGPRLLTEHMKQHKTAGREVAVLGPLLTPANYAMSPWVAYEQRTLVKQYDAMIRGDWAPTARQFYTGNASIRRSHVLAAGGFDERFRRAEDVDLAYRLADRGIGFVFTMQAEGFHFAERSFQSWFDAAYAYGRNDVVFGRDRGQAWLLADVRREYDLRNAQVRRLVRTCLGRPQATAVATQVLKFAAHTGARTGLGSLERSGCSGLFNLRYYQGFCDELGDPGYFFRPLQRSAAA
jgi:glycosyltransferase involved in cell wall biosynthesis